jgi:hypothetical protein
MEAIQVDEYFTSDIPNSLQALLSYLIVLLDDPKSQQLEKLEGNISNIEANEPVIWSEEIYTNPIYLKKGFARNTNII